MLRILTQALLAVCLIGVPVGAQAANSCAWINEATASGLLGGEVVSETSEAAAGQPAVCMFTQVTGGVKRTLRVTVEITSVAHTRLIAIAQSCCSDAQQLKAVGNEALICEEDDREPGISEWVVGRVRDQVFTIRIKSSLKNDPLMTRGILKSKIYTAAEQVAGNLF